MTILDAGASHAPIVIDADKCIRCRICDWVCPGDVIYKEAGDEDLPVVRYPDECWYCGHCEDGCPTQAITIVFPPQMIRCETPVEDLLGRIEPDEEVG